MHPEIFIFVVLLITARAQVDLACAGVPPGNFVRNSAACSSYYYCTGQVARAGDCPANFLFNARTQFCATAINVDCTDCSPFGIQHIPDPLGCNTYYRCVNGQKSRIQCDAGLMFDRQLGECNIAVSNHFCYSSICAPYAGFVKLGDPKNCNVFFSCLNGVPYEHKCAPSLYYNAHNGKCELPGSWNFCQGNGPLIVAKEDDFGSNPIPTLLPPPGAPTLPPFLPGTQPPATVRPPPATTRPPAATQAPGPEAPGPATQLPPWLIPPVTYPPGSNQLPPPPPPVSPQPAPVPQLPPTTPTIFNCADKENLSSYPHPTTCTKFIRCYRGRAEEVDCPSNQYWNNEKKQCGSDKPPNC